MGRPIYQYEMADADFSWLLNSFQEANPHYVLVDSSCLPLVLIKLSETEMAYSRPMSDGAESATDSTASEVEPK